MRGGLLARRGAHTLACHRMRCRGHQAALCPPLQPGMLTGCVRKTCMCATRPRRRPGAARAPTAAPPCYSTPALSPARPPLRASPAQRRTPSRQAPVQMLRVNSSAPQLRVLRSITLLLHWLVRWCDCAMPWGPPVAGGKWGQRALTARVLARGCTRATRLCHVRTGPGGAGDGRAGWSSTKWAVIHEARGAALADAAVRVGEWYCHY